MSAAHANQLWDVVALLSATEDRLDWPVADKDDVHFTQRLVQQAREKVAAAIKWLDKPPPHQTGYPPVDAQSGADGRLAAVSSIAGSLGYSLMNAIQVLHDSGVDDASVMLATDAIERAAWTAERIAVLAGGPTAAIKGSADGWFLSPVALELVEQCAQGAAS